MGFSSVRSSAPSLNLQNANLLNLDGLENVNPDSQGYEDIDYTTSSEFSLQSIIDCNVTDISDSDEVLYTADPKSFVMDLINAQAASATIGAANAAVVFQLSTISIDAETQTMFDEAFINHFVPVNMDSITYRNALRYFKYLKAAYPDNSNEALVEIALRNVDNNINVFTGVELTDQEIALIHEDAEKRDFEEHQASTNHSAAKSLVKSIFTQGIIHFVEDIPVESGWLDIITILIGASVDLGITIGDESISGDKKALTLANIITVGITALCKKTGCKYVGLAENKIIDFMINEFTSEASIDTLKAFMLDKLTPKGQTTGFADLMLQKFLFKGRGTNIDVSAKWVESVTNVVPYKVNGEEIQVLARETWYEKFFIKKGTTPEKLVEDAALSTDLGHVAVSKATTGIATFLIGEAASFVSGWMETGTLQGGLEKAKDDLGKNIASATGAVVGDVVGTMAGAAIGGALGGPVGAYIGGKVGGLVGSILGSWIGETVYNWIHADYVGRVAEETARAGSPVY